MRPTILVASMVAILVPAGASAQECRGFLYGAGVMWGSWMELSQADQVTWDGRSMDAIAAMGGTVIGGNFNWIAHETNRGVRDWTYADHQVELAEARNLEIFAYTGLTPDWALPPEAPAMSGIGHRFPPAPEYIDDFVNFHRDLAARYCGRVRYYTFWNEPNGCGWTNDGCANGDQAPAYTEWLIRWYAAMKEGCPDTVLGAGALDCNRGTGDGCAQYIEGIYASGGGDSFDAVAIHPYGNLNVDEALHWDAITGVHDVLVAHGHGDRGVWLNEWGWNTDDETLKATLVSHTLQRLEDDFPMATMALYLGVTDLPGTPDSDHDYGLCDRDTTSLTITPRASYEAFSAHPKHYDVETCFPSEEVGADAGGDAAPVADAGNTPADAGIAARPDGGAGAASSGSGCRVTAHTGVRSRGVLTAWLGLGFFAWNRRRRVRRSSHGSSRGPARER